jgi:hypothetical protein
VKVVLIVVKLYVVVLGLNPESKTLGEASSVNCAKSALAAVAASTNVIPIRVLGLLFSWNARKFRTLKPIGSVGSEDAAVTTMLEVVPPSTIGKADEPFVTRLSGPVTIVPGVELAGDLAVMVLQFVVLML